MIDPVGLATLLELTRPVPVDGIAGVLTEDSAADFFMKRQYEEIDDLTHGERKDVLEEAGRATFDAQTTRDLSRPATIGRALGPAVDQRRIRFVASNPDESAFPAQVELTAPFGGRSGHDVVLHRTSHSSGNKADFHLQREPDYEVVIESDTGTMDATTTIRLTNSLPRRPRHAAQATGDVLMQWRNQFCRFGRPAENAGAAERLWDRRAPCELSPGRGHERDPELGRAIHACLRR